MIKKNLTILLPVALAALAAASFCLQPASAAAQPTAADSEAIAKLVEGQPPLTADEIQQQIDFMSAIAAGQQATPPGGNDPARTVYIQMKINAAFAQATNPAMTADDVAKAYGTPAAVPTPEELELVKSRLADFPQPAPPAK